MSALTVDDGITGINGTAGDPDLDTLSGFATLDAAVLEFDFIPTGSQVVFDYVFSSDEYNEFVHDEFNDVFAFFVNGGNCATINGQPVSVNTINNGNPFGTLPSENAGSYINNDLDDGGGSINTEMDGLTSPLACVATVNPDVVNHMKLAIADASDEILDSNVFIRASSLVVPTPSPTPEPSPIHVPSPRRVRRRARRLSRLPSRRRNRRRADAGTDC